MTQFRKHEVVLATEYKGNKVLLILFKRVSAAYAKDLGLSAKFNTMERNKNGLWLWSCINKDFMLCAFTENFFEKLPENRKKEADKMLREYAARRLL